MYLLDCYVPQALLALSKSSLTHGVNETTLVLGSNISFRQGYVKDGYSTKSCHDVRPAQKILDKEMMKNGLKVKLHNSLLCTVVTVVLHIFSK